MNTAASLPQFGKAVGPWLLAAAVALCLLPFLGLCWYAHPSADDFLTGNQVREYGHWGYMRNLYLNWTGRYTSAVLWGLLHPVAYGNITAGYGPVCLLIILGVPAAFYGLLRTLLHDQFARWQLGLGSGVLTALFLFQMPSPAEGFYWIISDYNYVLPGCLTLLWLAALARHATAPTPTARKKWLAVAAGLAVAVIGGNETNALPLLIGVPGVTALRSLQRRRIEWDYVVLSAVVAAACAAAFLAPGNFVRMAQSSHPYSLLESADKAALSAYKSGLRSWVGNGVLPALTVLLAPVSYRLSRVSDLPLNRLARNPLFITLLMAVSVIVVLFLAWWTTGFTMPPRSRNVLYLFFLVGWFLSAHAWARLVWRRSAAASISLPGFVRWGLIAWVVGVFAAGHNFRLRGREPQDNANNVVRAYRDWLGGAAARYDAQLTARYQYLRTWTPDDVVVESLRDPPATLLFSDLRTNPNDWANVAYAGFFGKKSIRVPTEQPAPSAP